MVRALTEWAEPTPDGRPTAPSGVTAITVTYGDRGALAVRSATAALREGADRVVVVLNGAAAGTADMLRKHIGDSLELVELERNSGSARGFGAGIDAALADPETAWVWLLDDDNIPRNGALAALLAVRAGLGPAASHTALLAYRHDLAYMSTSLRLGHVSYPGPSAFLDFDAAAFIRRRLTPLRYERHLPETSEVPYAPYGGLLLPRTLLERIGLPDPQLFAYNDDTDFTGRIGIEGGTILLVRDSVIDDVAPSGLAATRCMRCAPKWAWFQIEDDWRAYYAMRNKVALERRAALSPTTFALNGIVVGTWLVVLGVASGRMRRLRLMLRALRDGLRGRLGEQVPVPEG